MQTVIDEHDSDSLHAISAAEQLLFEAIAQGIETRGYVILPAALPEIIAASLLDGLAQLELSEFHPAAIGRGAWMQRNRDLRRDRIFWIEQDHGASKPWLDWTTRLRLYLNRRLLLGLYSFESHFSIYQPGDFCGKHVDAFKGGSNRGSIGIDIGAISGVITRESNRVLSVVAYLNKGWEPGQGGELQLFDPLTGGELVKITPNLGTLVFFLSEEFPHEVLPTLRDRHAVAGWYRANNSINAGSAAQQ